MSKLLGVLKGRKFTSAMATAFLVALNDGLDLGLSEATINNIILVVVAFIAGESLIDGLAAVGARKAK